MTEHVTLVKGRGFHSAAHWAVCSCGWKGDTRYNAFEAENDATDHKRKNLEMKLETHALARLFDMLRRDLVLKQSHIGDAEREVGKIVDYVHSLEKKLDRIKEEVES